MSPNHINEALGKAYDEIIWSKGIADINFRVGIPLVFDNLMDKNRRIWIYEGKNWIGLNFGLQLN